MYPSVEERIHDMQQRRINACVRLPADHPLQPLMIEPIQFVAADAEGVDDHTGSESANIDVSLSPSQTTTKTNEPSIIQGLINHYSGELPGYETNLERASDLAFDEVMTESPQQQASNSEMASLTSTDFVIHPEHVLNKLFLNYLFLNKLFMNNMFLNKLLLTNRLQPTLFLNLKYLQMTNLHPLT